MTRFYGGLHIGENLGGYQYKYSISVSGQSGVKEFQYDQVFMEDSTQEKILEDTNISTVYLCQVREV